MSDDTPRTVEAAAKAAWDAMPHQLYAWETLDPGLLIVRRLKCEAAMEIEAARSTVQANQTEESA